MNLANQLQFKGDIPYVSEASPCFKPATFPPQDDFVISIDSDKKVVSRYGDDIWDFSPFGSRVKFHFSEYSKENASSFKQIIFYITYSHLFPGKYTSLTSWYFTLKNVFQICSKYNLDIEQLNRFPRVIEEIGESFAKTSPSKFRMSVYHLNAILKNRDNIGIQVLNEKNIALYKQFDPDYDLGQAAYIPNRIWILFIQHLDSILDDFEEHEQQLCSLYHYFVSTTLANENRGISVADSSPFNNHSARGKEFYGGEFEDCLEDYGLIELFEKYVKRPSRENYPKYLTDQFGALLNGIGLTCHLYILYYSLMRRHEAGSLKVDCLHIDDDDRFGEFYLLAGETTKTDPDSDARWVIPKRVKRAVDIAKTLIEWKVKYTPEVREPHALFQNLLVWQKKFRVSKERGVKSFDNLSSKISYLFRFEQFQIYQGDYDEALALTPNLINKDWFVVGGTWKFTFHQLRRTLAVHFAVNKVSASSTQLQMKHGTREQQYHYQNNAGKLRLNRSAVEEVVNEYYAEMSRNITSVIHGEVIIPHAKSPVREEIVQFITEGEKKKLLTAQKRGLVGYRKNILGGCMKQGVCEYGGFDSIAHCSGGDGGKPCAHLIIDGDREQEFRDDQLDHKNNMTNLPPNSPRYKALEAEIKGYGTVLSIIEEHRKGAK